MDLPTYTSIWRIEKRLYKLYDFRLPMPLPIGQITVFAAIAVPYVVLLTILGLPFNHTLVWLYVLPPGAATWLVTRPVLEGKRLPELVKSQVRYLAEPRVWCRMAPLGESDVIMVTGRVWRLSDSARAKAGRPVRARATRSVATPDRGQPARPKISRAATALLAQPVRPTVREPATVRPQPAVREPATVRPQPALRTRPAGRPRAGRPVRSPTAPPTRSASPPPASPPPASPKTPSTPQQTPLTPPSASPPRTPSAPASPPVVTVVNARQASEAPPALETALAGPAARRGDGRAGRVTVVPGGHRPGKPDQTQRDRARARLPISGPRRIVVLGCTVGAGQTVVTLLAGEVLASLRSDPIAVLDLNPGAESLARQAQRRPALGQAASLGPSRLEVLCPHGEPSPDTPEHDLDPADALAAFEQATATHQIVLADPSSTSVTRLLTIADQLVLVAPASTAAAGAIGMTFEWLDSHGHAGLVADAIMVMNGVSRRSMPHVEQAERVCIGRCRAIVRVPWDDQLKTQVVNPPSSANAGQRWTGLLSPVTVSACTALAGVLAATMAGPDAERERVPQ